jgi:hypothetical protein
MICFGLGRKVIDRMVGVLGRCRLVWRSGISYHSRYGAHEGWNCRSGWVGGGRASSRYSFLSSRPPLFQLSSRRFHDSAVPAQIPPTS